MRIADVAGMGVGNLGRRKGRTVLTLVGVVIGVAALVLLVSLGIGLKMEILKIFQDDEELLTIHVMRAKPESGKKEKKGTGFMGLMGPTVPVTDKDVEELRKLPGVESVTPSLNLLLYGKLGEESLGPVPVEGATDADVAKLIPHLTLGLAWAPGQRGCLVPSRLLQVKTDLKPEDVIGKSIVFTGIEEGEDAAPRTFTVTGVVDSEKIGLRGRQFFVPWTPAVEMREATGGGLFGAGLKKGTYQDLRVRVADPKAIGDVKNQLKNLNYEALTAADIIGMIDKLFYVIQGFMACIGAIGVIVALFGIANTMAMSVMERTREIGVMKAVGANGRDIRRVFLVEAASIGVIGGLAGLGLGALGALLLGWAARAAVDMPEEVTLFHVSPLLALGAVAFAVVVSMTAGLVPALRAARLDPVRALRHE